MKTNYSGTDMITDVRGRQFVVGQRVARAAKLYQTDGLGVIICEVTKIDGEKLYLDYSKQPIKFPDRLAILS